MGGEITLNNALRNGYASSRKKINKKVTKFYKENVYPQVDLYCRGIYTSSYKKVISDYSSSPPILPNEEKVDEVVDTRWASDNKLLKERLEEDHKGKLQARIDNTVRVAILSGKALPKVLNDIAKDIGVSYSAVDNLIKTETNFALNKAILDSLEGIGTDKYEFVAVLDSRTSATCRRLDNTIFKTSEAVVGINVPPLHNRCRSTIAPYIEEK